MAKVAVIKGDGVGPEVMGESVKLIDSLKGSFGIELQTVEFDLSAGHYLATGLAMPDGMVKELKNDFSTVLLGPLGDPRVTHNRHAREIMDRMKKEFDLFAIYYPVRLLNVDLCPLENKSEEDIDFIVMREGLEGISVGIGGNFGKETPNEVAIQEDINTKRGVERIIRFTFEEAMRMGRKKVTMTHNPTAMEFGYELWLRTFREVRSDYPGISASHIHIDTLVHQLVKTPEQFDMIVTNNLFGSILSSLGGALQGGFGLAACAYINGGKFAVFRPLLSSSPSFAGKDYANPMSAMLCVQLLMDHIGQKKAARGIEQTLRKAISSGWVTSDLGGSMGTSEVGDYICSSLVELAT